MITRSPKPASAQSLQLFVLIALILIYAFIVWERAQVEL
jgi:hypothetical protein